MKKTLSLIVLLSAIFSLTGCYYYAHLPPKSGSFSMAKTFSGLTSLEGKALQINFSEVQGIFAVQEQNNYVIKMLPGKNFAIYRIAATEYISSGTYTYRLSSKNPRQATLVFKNLKGKNVGKTMVMQLQYYSLGMGYFNIWVFKHKKTDYASGLFEVKITKAKKE